MRYEIREDTLEDALHKLIQAAARHHVGVDTKVVTDHGVAHVTLRQVGVPIPVDSEAVPFRVAAINSLRQGLSGDNAFRFIDALRAFWRYDIRDGLPKPEKLVSDQDLRFLELLTQLRENGWVVAIHNDYKLAGDHRTFWGFTKGERWLKGEGNNDVKALEEIERQRLKLVKEGEEES